MRQRIMVAVAAWSTANFVDELCAAHPDVRDALDPLLQFGLIVKPALLPVHLRMGFRHTTRTADADAPGVPKMINEQTASRPECPRRSKPTSSTP